MPSADIDKALLKVLTLERAVLTDDTKQVQEVYQKEGPFEFTARAVACAMRFRGVDMVRTLLDLGATLSYTATNRLDERYDTYFGEAWGRQKDFVKFLFPQDKTMDTALQEYHGLELPPVLDPEARLEVARYLADRRIPQLHMMYYYSILYDYMDVADMLEAKNINRLPAPVSDIIAGRIPSTETMMLGVSEYISEMRNQLKTYPHKTLAKVLTRFGKAITGKIDVSDCDDAELDAICDTDLFPVFAEYSNLFTIGKETEIMNALVAEGNAEGFEYVIAHKKDFAPGALAKLLRTAERTANSDNVADIIGEALQSKIRNTADPNAVSLTRADARRNWRFEVRDSLTPSIAILEYLGNSPDVTVPAYIGGLPVTHMSEDTFVVSADRTNNTDRQPITRLVIPGTVHQVPELFSLDKQAIRNRELKDKAPQKLKTLILDEGVKEIGASSFWQCTELEEVSLPASLRTIGRSAFYNAEALTHIDLPEGLETIGAKAFKRTGLKQLEIPATVASIDVLAFEDCKDLATVKIPTSTTLGPNCFGSCPKLADSEGRVVINATLAGYCPPAGIEGLRSALNVPASLEIESDHISVPTPYVQYPAILYRRPSDIQPEETVDPRKLKAGKIVHFGRFPLDKSLDLKPLEWRVLTVQNGKALLLTEHLILAWRLVPTNYTLRKSELPEFLNEVFLPIACNAREQAQIVSQADTRTGKTDSGVFLLTFRQIGTYLPRARKDRSASPTAYAYTQLSNSEHSTVFGMHDYEDRYPAVPWLIRPDGGNSREVNLQGKAEKMKNMITFLRPAVWIGPPKK